MNVISQVTVFHEDVKEIVKYLFQNEMKYTMCNVKVLFFFLEADTCKNPILCSQYLNLDDLIKTNFILII